MTILHPSPIRSVGLLDITPRPETSIRSSHGLLPLRLGGKPLSFPTAIGFCIFPRHVNHRLIDAQHLVHVLGVPSRRTVLAVSRRIDKLLILIVGHFVAINRKCT